MIIRVLLFINMNKKQLILLKMKKNPKETLLLKKVKIGAIFINF